MRWDIFLSYASEDKDYASELAESLKQENLNVWFDQNELQPGESIRKGIDQGLAESKMGLVVIGQTFFDKQWTSNELGALFSVQASTSKPIIPILHNVTHEYVVQRSPLLADVKSINSKIGTLGVAKIIACLFNHLDGHKLGAKGTITFSVNDEAEPCGIDETMIKEFRILQNEGVIPAVKCCIHRNGLASATQLPIIIYNAITDSYDLYKILKKLEIQDKKTDDERRLYVCIKEYLPQLERLERRINLGIIYLLTIEGATNWIGAWSDEYIAECIRWYVLRYFKERPTRYVKLDATMTISPYWHVGIYLTEKEKHQLIGSMDTMLFFLGVNVIDLPRECIIREFIPSILSEAVVYKNIVRIEDVPREVFDLQNWTIGLG